MNVFKLVLGFIILFIPVSTIGESVSISSFFTYLLLLVTFTLPFLPLSLFIICLIFFVLSIVKRKWLYAHLGVVTLNLSFLSLLFYIFQDDDLNNPSYRFYLVVFGIYTFVLFVTRLLGSSSN